MLHFAFIPILILLPILSRCIPKIKPKIAPMQNYLFWNGTIRLFMEAYLEFCLFALLNISALSWPEGLECVELSNWLAIVLVALTIAIPIWLGFMMCHNRKRWSDEDYSAKYGSYLDGMKSENEELRSVVLLFVCIFFARRMLMCLTLVFWQ